MGLGGWGLVGVEIIWNGGKAYEIGSWRMVLVEFLKNSGIQGGSTQSCRCHGGEVGRAGVAAD